MRYILLIAAVIITTGFIFRNEIRDLIPEKNSAQKKSKKIKDKSEARPESLSAGIIIKERWDLPGDLKEVSGIAYLDNDRFACVQDEAGTIFIYNKVSGKIENKISFSGAGDFEGITVKGNMAYVVRADGMLYEVNMETKKTAEYKTALTLQQNVEGLCYDEKNNRLLLAIKDNEPGNPGYKGIYAFDLSKNNLLKEPVFKIDLQNEILNNGPLKKNRPFMPSSIGIQPTTNDIFITDGPKSTLLIMDKTGKIKKLYQLGKEFVQPEGITFNPKGDIYISNEGTKNPGNIIQVEIQ